MFTDLVPYPEDARLTSLWHVPAGWSTPRLRAVSQMIVSSVDKLSKAHEEPVQLCNYVDVYGNDLITELLPFMRATATNEEIRQNRLRLDDVVVTKDSESWKDIAVPAYVTYEAEDLVCGYHLAILRSHKEALLGAYLFRTLQVPQIAHQFHVAAGGVTRYGLSHDDIKSARIPLPPKEEQAAIVRYLAHANRRIDQAIAAKRKLIRLLEEQKQVIISQAVTRGLDPRARMKDSGIPWLGEIPEHWNVPLLGRLLLRLEQGWSPMAAEGGLSEDQWGVLSLSAVDRGAFVPTAVKPIPARLKVPRNLEIHNGDLLLTRSNTRSRVGDVAIVRDVRTRVILSDLMYRLTPDALALDSGYLWLFLRSTTGRLQIERDARGSSDTMPKIGQGHIRAWRILLPPRTEQVQLTARVAQASRAVEQTISRTSRELDLLREFRTRLTADVVTGQVDVRAITATLPDFNPDEWLAENSAEAVADDELDAVAEEYAHEES